MAVLIYGLVAFAGFGLLMIGLAAFLVFVKTVELLVAMTKYEASRMHSKTETQLNRDILTERDVLLRAAGEYEPEHSIDRPIRN